MVANAIAEWDAAGNINTYPMDEDSRRMFAELRDIAVAAREGRLSRDEAVAEAAKISKHAAKAVGWAIDTNTLALFLAMLTFLYTVWSNHSTGRDTKAFQNQLLREMQKQDYHQEEVIQAIKGLEIEKLVPVVRSKPPVPHPAGSRKERRKAEAQHPRKTRHG